MPINAHARQFPTYVTEETFRFLQIKEHMIAGELKVKLGFKMRPRESI